MKKNIFDDDYFAKHRDNSQWEGLKKKNITTVLNVKNKPIKRIDPPIQKNFIPEKKENIIDHEYKSQKKQNTKWKSEYIKSVISGFCGGIIVLLILNVSNYEGEIVSFEGIVNTSILLVLSMIFFIFFAGIFYFLENET